MCIRDRTYIDSLLIQTDGTDNKSNLGANATLGVSMAAVSYTHLTVKSKIEYFLLGILCKVGVIGSKLLDGSISYRTFSFFLETESPACAV